MISRNHTGDLAADFSPPSRQLLPVQIFVSEPEWQWCQSVILTKTVFTLKTSLSTEGHLEIMTQSLDPQTLFSLLWSSSVRNWLWTITVIEKNITGRYIFFYFHHGQILRDLPRLSPNVRNLSGTSLHRPLADYHSAISTPASRKLGQEKNSADSWLIITWLSPWYSYGNSRVGIIAR